eukprot:3837991-Amphidinium_carterae.1
MLAMGSEGDKRHRLLARLEDIAVDLGKSPRQTLRWLQAVAEASVRHQSVILQQVLCYVQLMQNAGSIVPKLLIHRVKHDETQMIVRATYGKDTELHEHKARIFMVQEEWTVVVQVVGENADFYVLKGGFSPKLVVGQSATGESIADVLEKTLIVPSIGYGVCEKSWQVLETDECPANIRAAKVFASDTGIEVPVMHFCCNAHKAHQVAKNLWDTCPVLHSGLVQVIKVLKSPGMYQKFQDKLLEKVSEPNFLHITNEPLSEQAIQFRTTVLNIFTPRQSDKPAAFAVIQVVARDLLNGDWRVKNLQHRCQGCCQTRGETEAKLRKYLPRFLKALRLTRVETADWSNWQDQLNFVGALGHIHGIFTPVFEESFRLRLAKADPPSIVQNLLVEQANPPPHDTSNMEAEMMAKMLLA